MGLDITAYEKATLVPEAHERETAERTCYESAEYGGLGHVHAYSDSPDFAQSTRGLELGCCYATEGEEIRFRAGSYSGYNEWRRILSRRALGVDPSIVWDDPNTYAHQPFYELIHFSDCEGTIGPEAAADLARDFAEHRERVCSGDVLDHTEEWFQNRYDDWAAAFKLAAGTGLVDFH